MVTREEEEEHHHHQLDWSIDLIDSIWFHIGNYLNINDIHRLTRTCSHLYRLFISNDFWSYLIRKQYGNIIWYRLIKNSSLFLNDQENRKHSRSKLIYFELIKRKRISFADLNRFSLDTNRNYKTLIDPSSLTGYVLYIKDSIELCYLLHIQTIFYNILPGKYDVIWRMKLDLPYILGETEFLAIPEQTKPSQIAYMKWTQEDFLSMYRCFNCDITKTNLWFYQTIGIIEINDDKPCNVHISLINQDSMHAKHGLYLDYVELKLRLE